MASRMASAIEARLKETGDAARAKGAKAYLKSELVHLGVTVPALRAVVKEELRRGGERGREEVVAAVVALWRKEIFELKAAAVELLMMKVEVLEADDAALIERMVREARTWALVDSLAVHVMGRLVERYRALGKVLDRWAGDEDFWIRRAAMLSLLLGLRAGDGDFARFGRYADAMLEEREFFIRKAIGWVLRETAKKRPALVVEWLAPRIGRAAGLTVREAVKHLPVRERERLLRARR